MSAKYDSAVAREILLKDASDQFLRGEITAMRLKEIEDEHSQSLKSAVVALAVKDIKQRRQMQKD